MNRLLRGLGIAMLTFFFVTGSAFAVTTLSADIVTEGALSVDGTVALGDGSSSAEINSTNWDISTSGIAQFATGDCDGTPVPGLALGAATTGLFTQPVGVAAVPAISFCIDGVKAGFISIGSTPATNSYGNTVIGWGSGLNIDLSGGGAGDDALHNSAFGSESLVSLTTGMQNTAIGNRVLHDVVTGSENTCVGQGSCFEIVGSTNTAVGYHAMVNVVPAAAANTAIGFKVLEGTAGAGATATGDENVMVGYESAYNFSTASKNAVLGYQASKEITTGVRNTIMGYRAGDSITTSSDNVFIGHEAGAAYTTQGTASTFIGRSSGANATGTNNTGVGFLSLGGVSSGFSNTAVGHLAGVTPTTGFQNVFIGDGADGTAIGTQDAIAIGYAVTAATGIGQFGSATQTAFRTGTIKTSGTVASFRTPGAIANDTITLPTCSSTENTLAMIAVDDSNDGAPAMMCWCRAGADDSAYSWVSVHDNATACIDP